MYDGEVIKTSTPRCDVLLNQRQEKCQNKSWSVNTEKYRVKLSQLMDEVGMFEDGRTSERVLERIRKGKE